jgi:23S rRNA pseudouridine1911/1915/1917 synthase
VLDKPAGLVVHPAPGNEDGTLVNALLAHCGDSLPGIGGERRPGIVHRLDKDTSGVMVVAKTEQALAGAVRDAFAARDLDRAYLALVPGACRTPPAGEIEGAIGRDPRDRKRMAVVARGGKRGADPLPHAAHLACASAAGMPAGHRAHPSDPRAPGQPGHPVVGDPGLSAPHPGGAGCPARSRLRRRLLDFPRQALHARPAGLRPSRTGRQTPASCSGAPTSG